MTARSDTRQLHLNVGFLLKEGAGYTREFAFDAPGAIRLEDVTISRLTGTLRLTRTPQGIVVQGVLHAERTVECVRCLAPVQWPIEVPFEELFRPATDPQAGEPDAAYYVIDEGGIIDLTPIVREEGIVSVPMQVRCQPDCRGLCPTCGQNLNEADCGCGSEQVDPRLASLRALLTDDE